MPTVRLQKVIQQAGIASRRDAEEMIREGLVRVNGAIVSEMGFKVDPARDAVKVDGKRIFLKDGPAPLYLALYKPRGVICTAPQSPKQATCFGLLPPRFQNRGLTYAGRLDIQTEGLLLLSNDGDFIQHCAHPRHRVAKTYHVKARGNIRESLLEKLRKGIYIDAKRTLPARVRRLRRESTKHTWVEIEISEGRNRIVRKMFFAIGHGAIKLKRVKIGRIGLGRLKPGECRPLTRGEIQSVLRA